ncbi:MAG: cobalt ECF transporter T component CbiQ [Holdemanella sp.]|nr:cobalt ECF transporter T component CbiQ [Holdemanella sp.]
MTRINDAIYEIISLDTLANRNKWVNRIHPLIKLLVTLFYIIITVSFNRYDIIGLLAMIIYPILLFGIADLSLKDCLKRIFLVLPILIFMGILNPFFDRTPVLYLGIQTTTGILSMITLIMKGSFCILASYILVATTKIDDICYSLSILHIPDIIITEFILIYRYLSVLLIEVNRITQAYSLRAPNQKGIHFKVWGSLTGQLLLRSMDKANLVYESMTLRGYNTNYIYLKRKIKGIDWFYGIIWVLLFILFRRYPILLIAGGIL